MRAPWITNAAALRARMVNPAQLQAPSPEAEMPPYMESFLAHLRLLVGVPFDYLLADSRLLPPESIRFFYIDRSWTDRLVDGAVSIGKIGTREQSHHQAHGAGVQQQLDVSEKIVRILQRRLQDFPTAKSASDQNAQPADLITGFLLRSAAVVGWPHMDVRAFSGNVPAGIDPSQIDPKLMLPLLRLERLSPSVLIALFRGVPTLVWCEEPHHGVQFGVEQDKSGRLIIPVRDASGHLVLSADISKTQIALPMRTGGRRVIAVAQLRKDIIKKDQDLSAQGLPHLPAQSGAAGFAISVLNPPWRQRFRGAGGRGAFQGGISVTTAVDRPALTLAVKDLVK
ncbi:MAG: hypothetical protein ACXWIP_21470 [Burkholderiales bacterium]